MIGKKTISASTAAFAALGFIIVACSDKPGGGGGGGDEGGTMSGAGGMATGGTPTGGVSGTGPTGGVTTGGSTTGGSATGGAGGASGAGGSTGGGAGGGGATGPFKCDMPVTASCNSIGDFPTTTAQTWGTGDFSGGISIFPSGMATTIMRDADTTKLHMTGMVSGYGVGFNIWFSKCSTLAAHTGVMFTISGTTTDMTAMEMNSIDFQLQTNANYPWQAFPAANGKGDCTAVDAANPWGMCIAPGIKIPLQAGAQTVTWAQMMGGMPTAWSATTSPAELIGIQWQFRWSEGRMPYTFDVTLDDISFPGGTATACPPYMAGGGGMGGAGGAPGGAGGAPGGAGGAPGGASPGGAGGASAGAGGAGAGRGGMAGAAGG